MDTVATRLGADIDDRIAHARRSGIEDTIGIRDADGHRIDEDIAVIGRMKIRFPGHGRHAHAIAIAADARDHSLYQMLHLGVIGPTESKRVGIGHGTCAHGENVAQDSAHARRGTLIGFDIAGVVVALHLEDGCLPVADIDHARILAGTTDDPGRLGRQLFEMETRAFVAAMFRPHYGEYAELDQIGLTPQRTEDTLVLLLAQAMRFDDFGGDG